MSAVVIPSTKNDPQGVERQLWAAYRLILGWPRYDDTQQPPATDTRRDDDRAQPDDTTREAAHG